MDRNHFRYFTARRQPRSLSARRAWIEIQLSSSNFATMSSLSARRAWIEMSTGYNGTYGLASLSARRAWIEMTSGKQPTPKPTSLSARRAWIEMARCANISAPRRVALRKESVDRNQIAQHGLVALAGRSPQGERG